MGLHRPRRRGVVPAAGAPARAAREPGAPALAIVSGRRTCPPARSRGRTPDRGGESRRHVRSLLEPAEDRERRLPVSLVARRHELERHASAEAAFRAALDRKGILLLTALAA